MTGAETRNAAGNNALFRRALGSFVTGVTIVTCADADGAPVGLTANSFNSVSLDPPMVLWSLALDSRSLGAFRQASHWAVHILAADQQDISNRFARSAPDKFDGLDYAQGPDGTPLLSGYAARFVCKAGFEYDGGDHAIFVGEVVDHDQRDAEPLVYHGGQYGQMLPVMAPPVPPELADETIASLAESGLIEPRGEGLHLTGEGQALLLELVAAAQASHLSVEDRLSEREMRLLQGLLHKLLAE